MKLKYIKELRNIRKLSNFFDNTYSTLLQYIEKKEFIELKINGQAVKVSRRLFEQLAYSILSNKISSIEVSGNQIIINNEVRIFSCNDYFNDNLILALNLSEEAKELGWRIEDGLWTNGKVKFLVMLIGVMHSFNYNIYYVEGIKGRDVVDIGGSIGDTAIFYKLHGARNVISVEPLSLPYNLAKTHLKINNVNSVNFIRGALVSNKAKKYMKIPRCYPLYGSGSFSLINQEYTMEEDIPTFTLSEILPDDPYILKMDCEGCEYDIILKDYDTIRQFEIINFHYHEKETGISHHLLIDKLKQDYTIEVYYRPGEEQGKYYGMILAKKKH